VQEALTNVVKHAGAEHARVDVRERDGALEVTVHDDGGGFAPDEPTQGFGVAGMRERAGLLDGTFSLRSAPGTGTTVTARLPLPAQLDSPSSRPRSSA
jgi:signal transduction histidine kinase